MFVLFSADGPNANVLKFKSPMCFNKENADELVKKLDQVFTEIAEITMNNGPLGKESLAAHGVIDHSSQISAKKFKNIAGTGDMAQLERDH